MKSFRKLLCIYIIVIFTGIIHAGNADTDTVQMTYESLQSQQTVL